MSIEIINIHIPKCGGTTLRNCFVQVYGKENILTLNEEQLLSYKWDDMNADVKVLHGHFTFDNIRGFDHLKNIKKIVWLRDPVQRVISHYFFNLHQEYLKGKDVSKFTVFSFYRYILFQSPRNEISRILSGSNFNDFFYVGFQENFENDIIKLTNKMNWNRIDLKKINCFTDKESSNHVRFKPSDVTFFQRILVKILNYKDYKLYMKLKGMNAGF